MKHVCPVYVCVCVLHVAVVRGPFQGVMTFEQRD